MTPQVRPLARAVLVALYGGDAPREAPRFLWPEPTHVVYPYYTVDSGTPKRSRASEVMDFNLFLSPDDVWTAVRVRVP